MREAMYYFPAQCNLCNIYKDPLMSYKLVQVLLQDKSTVVAHIHLKTIMLQKYEKDWKEMLFGRKNEK